MLLPSFLQAPALRKEANHRPRTAHLFEEPGTSEEVAEHVCEWLKRSGKDRHDGCPHHHRNTYLDSMYQIKVVEILPARCSVT